MPAYLVFKIQRWSLILPQLEYAVILTKVKEAQKAMLPSRGNLAYRRQQGISRMPASR